MSEILKNISNIGIIPVIAFNSVKEAVPLCKALVDGELPAPRRVIPQNIPIL